MVLLEEIDASPDGLTSIQLCEILEKGGSPARGLSERSIRLHLAELEEQGLILSQGRKGKILTDRGREELAASRLMNRVGNMAARIDALTWALDFDLEQRRGKILTNYSLVPFDALRANLEDFLSVFQKGYAMGRLLALYLPGQTVNERVVPEGMACLATVCSVTLNGLLLKRGIPVRSLFSGLLEIRHYQPQSFTDLILYEGTSLDPLELYIRSGLTNYLGAIRHGHGRIGAGFREVPAASRDQVEAIAAKAERLGMGAFMRIGEPEKPVFNIPVRESSCGVVVIGGLNPLSVFQEHGHRIEVKAMAGLEEYQLMFSYEELPDRLRAAGLL